MLKKLNAAMDYIEAHLEEDFRLEEVAAGVGISDLSFRQLFYALTGMTLQEYVKNRRLSVRISEGRGLKNGKNIGDCICL